MTRHECAMLALQRAWPALLLAALALAIVAWWSRERP